MRPSALDAGIGVLDKRPLVQSVSIVVIQMMHDSVPEDGSEYFAHLGILDNEALRGQGSVAAMNQVVAQFLQILFQIRLPFAHIRPKSLVLPCIVVCNIEIEKKLFLCQNHDTSIMKKG